jgi:hypothetical protein
MSSEFPGRPMLLKGALIVFGAPIPVPTNIIIFQYNPETMTRKIAFPNAGQDGNSCLNSGDTPNVNQPPTEAYSLTVELDATDQIEDADTVTLAVGLHPALAALELLLYPSSTVMLLNKALVAFGSSMIAPPQVPLVLFVWGAARVVPVQVSSVSITETAFDQLLNPIQAKVDLGMRSLALSELKHAVPPFSTLGIVNQVAKEVMARFQIGGIAAQAESKVVRGLLPF